MAAFHVFAFILGFLTIGILPATASPNEPVDELHAVGVYEGRGRHVDVLVDRPGKSVGLALAAYEGVEWRIRLSQGTRIETIGVFGYHAERVTVTVVGEPRAPEHRDGDISYAQSVHSSTFRALVAHVPPLFGKTRFDSFQGAYRPDADGFTIDRTEPERAELGPDYLRTLLLPAENRPDLTFPLDPKGRPGLYDLAGQLVPSATGSARFDAAPDVAYDGRNKVFYLFTAEGFRQLDGAGRPGRLIPPDGSVPGISWPRAAVYDPVRHRLLGITSHVGIRVYALDLEHGTWSLLPAFADARGIDRVDGIVHDPESDRFILSVVDHVRPALVTMAPEGDAERLAAYAFEAVPGYADLFNPGNDPGADFTIRHWSGRYGVITASEWSLRRPWSGTPIPYRIYLFDSTDKTVSLTHYQDELNASVFKNLPIDHHTRTFKNPLASTP